MATRTTLTRAGAVAVLCVFAGAGTGARQGTDGDPTEQRFAVSGVPDIVVKNDTDGETTVRASADADDVRVRIVREGRDADELGVRLEQDGDRITVEARRPHRRWFSWGRGPRAHIEIEAPARSDIDARNDDGALSVTGFEGRLRLAVDDGDLLMTDTSGELRAVVDDGHLDLRQVTGEVELRNDDGRLTVNGFDGRLQLAVDDGRVDITDATGELTAVVDDGDLDLRQVSGSVTVRTDDGDVRLDGVLTALHARTDDGHVEIRAEAGSQMAEDWSVRADDGGVALALPHGFAADLVVRTDNGDAEIEQPITVHGTVSRHRISGELNGGGHELRVESDDGRVSITR